MMKAFSLPLGDAAGQRAGLREAFGPSTKPEPLPPVSDERTAHRQAIAELLGWRQAESVAPAAVAAATESDAATLTRLSEVLSTLEVQLGREVLTAADRAALEADPLARAAWLGKIAQVEAALRARADAAAVTSAGEVEAAAARERGRLVSTGLLLALEAQRGGAK